MINILLIIIIIAIIIAIIRLTPVSKKSMYCTGNCEQGRKCDCRQDTL